MVFNRKKTGHAVNAEETQNEKASTLTLDDKTYDLKDLPESAVKLAQDIADADEILHRHQQESKFISDARDRMIGELKEQLNDISPIST